MASTSGLFSIGAIPIGAVLITSSGWRSVARSPCVTSPGRWHKFFPVDCPSVRFTNGNISNQIVNHIMKCYQKFLSKSTKSYKWLCLIGTVKSTHAWRSSVAMFDNSKWSGKWKPAVETLRYCRPPKIVYDLCLFRFMAGFPTPTSPPLVRILVPLWDPVAHSPLESLRCPILKGVDEKDKFKNVSSSATCRELSGWRGEPNKSPICRTKNWRGCVLGLPDCSCLYPHLLLLKPQLPPFWSIYIQ